MKSQRKKSIISVIIILFLIVAAFSNQNVQAKQALAVKPKLQIITQPQKEYNRQDTISFKVQAPNYTGKVEYRVILYNGTTKTTTNLWNSPKTGYFYRGWQPTGTYQFEIKWSASQLQPGAYSMTVLVRKANGINSYDSYIDTKSFWVMEDSAIESIKDITIDMYQDEKFDFPKKVIAEFGDGSSKEVPITWDSPSLDVTKTGAFVFEGIVKGYNEKVKMTVNIISKSIQGNTSENINSNASWRENGEWVYNIEFGRYIYKMRLDGSEKYMFDVSKILNINGTYFLRTVYIVDDQIYTIMGGYNDIIETNAGIYKFSLDGKQATAVTKDNVWNMCVAGEWIYYYNKSDGYRLYKIKTDGTNKIKLDNDSSSLSYSSRINVIGDWIYYTHYDKAKGRSILYKMKIDGTNKTKLADHVVRYALSGGWIYYTGGSKIYKMRQDGSENTVFIEVNNVDFGVSGDWFYYCKWIAYNQYNLYRVRLDGTNNTKLTDSLAINVNVIGDWIYFTRSDQGTDYMIKIDGTEEQKIEWESSVMIP